MQENGIIATAKHFPGDGYCEYDQHLTAPVNPLPFDEWMASFGESYKAPQLSGNFLDVEAKKYTVQIVRCIFLPQRLPTFPGSCPPSIIGTTELNYCVRYGYRCVLRVIVTEFLNTIYLR